MHRRAAVRKRATAAAGAPRAHRESFVNLYDAGVTPMAEMLGNMVGWLDKAEASGHDAAALMEARLAPDMHPFARQIQIASDMSKNGGARLAGVEAPSMPDTETDLAQLKERCRKTAAFLQGLDRAAVRAADDRTIELRFPNGMAFDFSGADYLTHFVLPNFYFHATTAYALLRSAGVGLGKADFMANTARFAKATPTAD